MICKRCCFFFLLLCLTTCRGYPGGAPWNSCFVKVPKHKGTQQQSSDPPYEITLSKNSYSLGESITVTLKSKTTANLFRGLILGAHPVTGDTENAVGKFVSIPDDCKGISWYATTPSGPNCVTHNSNGDRQSSTFTWQAPTQNFGNLIFTAAVVKNFKTFWTNVSSAVLVSNSASSVPSFTAALTFTSSLSTTIPDDVAGCGSKHGCILYPRYCKGASCEIIVQFDVETTSTPVLNMKMVAMSRGYFALAVSEDKKMGGDFVIVCGGSSNRAQASLQNGYNDGYSYERHRIYNYSNVRLHYNDQKVYCSFQRPLDISITRVKVDSANMGSYSEATFDMSKPRFVFLATGSLHDGLQAIAKHSQLPIITTSPVDFQSKNVSAVQSKIHFTL